MNNETMYKTAHDWIFGEDILSDGQPGVEIDTGKVKLGDGESIWNALEYVSYMDYIGKNKETVSPEDYGPLSNDDTDIINLALSSGKNVCFTDGVEYHISGTLNVNSSDTVITGKGAKLIVESIDLDESTSDYRMTVFNIPTGARNIVMDSLNIKAPRDRRINMSEEITDESFEEIHDESTGDNTKTYYYDSNRTFFMVYQNVHNLIIQNGVFEGAKVGLRFHASNNVTEDNQMRKNMVFTNNIFIDVGTALDGGRHTEGINVDKIYIDAADTTDYYHSIYLRTDLSHVRINDFYIKQPNSVGAAISIYTIEATENSCTNPIYLSNGEIHAKCMGASSNPYVIYADNVRFVLNEDYTKTMGLMFTHWEDSFGYFNNCTFENCLNIENAEYSNCKFKLKSNATELIRTNGTHHSNTNVKRTVLNNCMIDINNAGALIYLIKEPIVTETEYETEIEVEEENAHTHYIELNNCTIDSSGEIFNDERRIVSMSKEIRTAYTVRINGCRFNNDFGVDLYNLDLNHEEGSLDLLFRNTSIKTTKTGFVKTPVSSRIQKRYLYCDLNDTEM